MKSTSPIRRCLLILVIPLLLLASIPGAVRPVHAFTLIVHKEILRGALQGKMSEQALDWVIGYYAVLLGSGNLGSDVHLLTAERHFANAPAPAVICQRWHDGFHRYFQEAIDESAPAGAGLRSIPERESALKVFGEATHSLADFYAHTNWIELAVAHHQRPKLAPLLGNRCNPRAFPRALQSGYGNHFKVGLTGMISGCPRTGPPNPYRYCDSQLNKDSDAPGHHGHDRALPDGTSYFQLAKRLAAHATAALWDNFHQRIVARYGKTSRTEGACVFYKLAWGGATSCTKNSAFTDGQLPAGLRD